MKIAVLSSHTPSLFYFRMDMMKDMIAKGHEVVALGNDSEEIWKDKFLAKGIRYRRIYVFRNATNPLQDVKTFFNIKKILKEERPDKIFTYQAKTVIYGTMAAKALGIESFALIAGLGSLFLNNSFKQLLKRLVMVTGYKSAFQYSTKVFFQNKDDSRAILRAHLIKEDKIVYINGSGVNIDTFVPTPLPEQPTFLMIGRLIRDKGLQEYLDACRVAKAQNGKIRCLLVGPYDTNPTAVQPQDIQEYIDDGTIEYFGEQSDVRPYIEMCNVYVLPSYHEGTPKTVLEAMACGRAVITTDAAGCRETVINGVNGYLVPVKDTDSLVHAMLSLASAPETVAQMGSAGRLVAIDKYDVHKVNEIIMQTMRL